VQGCGPNLALIAFFSDPNCQDVSSWLREGLGMVDVACGQTGSTNNSAPGTPLSMECCCQ
jgi:hypothetical protein